MLPPKRSELHPKHSESHCKCWQLGYEQDTGLSYGCCREVLETTYSHLMGGRDYGPSWTMNTIDDLRGAISVELKLCICVRCFRVKGGRCMSQSLWHQHQRHQPKVALWVRSWSLLAITMLGAVRTESQFPQHWAVSHSTLPLVKRECTACGYLTVTIWSKTQGEQTRSARKTARAVPRQGPIPWATVSSWGATVSSWEE